MHAEQGLTLVEILVAMGLGVLLIFGATQVFDSSREGTQVQNAMASMQDSGRIAMEFISRDLRAADFSGCLQDKSRLQNLLSTSSSNYNAEYHTFYATGGISGVQSASSLTLGGASVANGTSTLAIVGAQPACDGITAIDSSAVDEDDPLVLRASCPIDPGTVLLVSNCYYGDIFVKTNAASDTNIQHTTTAVSGLANASAAFQTTYKSDAQIFEPFVRQYFVAPGSNGNDSLYRRENGQNRELVTNVVNFQVTYGQDSDGDDAADNFAGTFADMSSVVSARIVLTVRSDNLIDGAPLTRTYTSTSSIRNRTVNSEADPDA